MEPSTEVTTPPCQSEERCSRRREGGWGGEKSLSWPQKCIGANRVDHVYELSALDINNGTKTRDRSVMKINQKHWAYATGTCHLSC